MEEDLLPAKPHLWLSLEGCNRGTGVTTLSVRLEMPPKVARPCLAATARLFPGRDARKPVGVGRNATSLECGCHMQEGLPCQVQEVGVRKWVPDPGLWKES